MKRRMLVLVFSLLAIASLQDVQGSLDSCQSDCKDKYHDLKKKSKEVIDACSMGCRLAHIDLLTRPLATNISYCKESCQEAFMTSLQQMACSVGCNQTCYEDTSTTGDENDILTSLYLMLNEAFFSSFFTSNVNVKGGNTMEITVVTAEDNNAKVQDTIIFITGAANPKSNTQIKHPITVIQDEDDNNEDSINLDIWFILQVIAVLLLLILLTVCCCTCSGEARHNLNKRSRDIKNCNEESDSNAFKSHTHKLREPLGRPCITPISPHIVPVKGNMATTGRQIKTLDGRILMVV